MATHLDFQTYVLPAAEQLILSIIALVLASHACKSCVLWHGYTGTSSASGAALVTSRHADVLGVRELLCARHVMALQVNRVLHLPQTVW